MEAMERKVHKGRMTDQNDGESFYKCKKLVKCNLSDKLNVSSEFDGNINGFIEAVTNRLDTQAQFWRVDPSPARKSFDLIYTQFSGNECCWLWRSQVFALVGYDKISAACKAPNISRFVQIES